MSPKNNYNHLNYVFNRKRNVLDKNTNKETRKVNHNKLSMLAGNNLFENQSQLKNIKENDRYAKLRFNSNINSPINIQNREYRPDYRIQKFSRDKYLI